MLPDTVPSPHVSQAIAERGVKQVGSIINIDTAAGSRTTTPAYIPDNRSSDSILVAPVTPEP